MNLPMLRRLRAVLVIMFTWGLATALIATLLGTVLLFGRPPVQDDYFRFLRLWLPISAGFGALAGGGFAAMLALRAPDRVIVTRRRGMNTLAAFLISALAGVLILVIAYWIDGAPVYQLFLFQPKRLLIRVVVFGSIGAVVGTGILAAAHRGKALPGEAETTRIGSGPEE